jgi:hypothetical protein
MENKLKIEELIGENNNNNINTTKENKYKTNTKTNSNANNSYKNNLIKTKSLKKKGKKLKKLKNNQIKYIPTSESIKKITSKSKFFNEEENKSHNNLDIKINKEETETYLIIPKGEKTNDNNILKKNENEKEKEKFNYIITKLNYSKEKEDKVINKK